MGYTHYLRGLQCDAELADFAKAAVALSDVQICGPTGTGTVVICEDSIQLNGSAENGEDYESFILPGLGCNSFCKTAREPYDKVVTAILIDAIVLKVSGWENISSDGTEEDWAKGGGVALFMKTAKEHYDLELDYGDIMDVLRTFLSGTEEKDYVEDTNKAVASTNKGGYEASYLRQRLNSEFLKLFPEDMIDMMVPFENGDRLRLPTEKEMFGTNKYGEFEAQHVKQWKPMKKRGNCLIFNDADDEQPQWYWLMNRYRKSTAHFLSVDSRGYTNYYEASSCCCWIRPVFKLKNC